MPYSRKKNTACGIDEIPNEVLKSKMLCTILINMLNMCYEKGLVPSIWKQGIINPIPKSSTSDPRDPLIYRGITLTPVCYKLYCNMLKMGERKQRFMR